jgi:hypothetical protein
MPDLPRGIAGTPPDGEDDMTTFADPDSAVVAGPKPPPTVMRGPEHAENYRMKVGRYKERWYRDPLPADDIAPAVTDDDEAYPSVSTVKGASGKDWSYVSLKRIAHSDDLSDIAAKGYYERYERFKVINQLSLSEAMRRGTNVHTWAECIAYGIPQYLDPKGEGGTYFPTVDKLFADLQPKLVAAEFVCIDRELGGVGYGGTSDGIFEIDGKLYMVDWKSRGADSDHACYPEEAAQIGAYVGCQYVIVADDDPSNPHGAKRMQMPQLDGGLIVSIKPDSYEVYPVDLDEALRHWWAMHAWWVARRSEGRALGPKWAPRRAVLMEQLEASIDHVRREKLYARHDTLSAKQRAEFAERAVSIDTANLDAVEQLLDDIESPPRLVDLSLRRQAADRARDADRRLSLEGGEPDPDDIRYFEVAWELALTVDAKRWLARIVQEAIDGKVDFRFSVFPSQRRADIYCALTQWGLDVFGIHDDDDFRTALVTIATSPVSPADSLGYIVGSLTATEAADLRQFVNQIVGEVPSKPSES